jgi:hypothetical protein
MIKKTITYTDYNGNERTEDHYFDLSKAELMEMELGTAGGLADMIKNIVAAQDTPSIVKIFKKLVLQAYGEKSPDGKRFLKVDEKGNPLSVGFSQTEAYSNLFMELATDADAAAKFVRGIVPGDIDISDVDPNEMPAGVAEMLKQTAPAPTNITPIEPQLNSGNQ